MRVSLNTSKWYDNIWAALIFFTRLPLWRLHEPPRECFRSVVEYWPLTGWITGGLAALIIWFGDGFLPYSVVILIALAARMLLTGALHEDGLADFFDGFGGGGNDRKRILDIMKDSRTGTYGVLALVAYLLILFFTLYSLPAHIAAMAVFAADPYAKIVSSQLIMMMPYARSEEESKAKTVYRRMGVRAGIVLFLQGALPFAWFIYNYGATAEWQYLAFAPCLVMYFLYLMIWKKLRGYTGDCCGAVFLLTELAFYLSLAYRMNIGSL